MSHRHFKAIGDYRGASLPHSFTTFRGVSAVIAGAVSLVLMAGCTTGAEPEATPTATETAAPLTLDGIGETFPTTQEWLLEYNDVNMCDPVRAESGECGEGKDEPYYLSNGFMLKKGITDGTPGAIILSVREWATAEEAAAAVEEQHTADLAYSGDFDTPPEASTQGTTQVTTLGLRGSGVMSEFEFEGWSGHRVDYLATDVGGTEENPQPVAYVTMGMSHGPFAFLYRLYRTTDTASAEEKTDYWLGRTLGGLPFETGVPETAAPKPPTLVALVEPQPASSEEALATGAAALQRYVDLTNDMVLTGNIDQESVDTTAIEPAKFDSIATGQDLGTEAYTVSGKATIEILTSYSGALRGPAGVLDNASVNINACYITTEQKITMPDGSAVETDVPEREEHEYGLMYLPDLQGWRVRTDIPTGIAC